MKRELRGSLTGKELIITVICHFLFWSSLQALNWYLVGTGLSLKELCYMMITGAIAYHVATIRALACADELFKEFFSDIYKRRSKRESFKI